MRHTTNSAFTIGQTNSHPVIPTWRLPDFPFALIIEVVLIRPLACIAKDDE
jgi:hypothetical protein